MISVNELTNAAERKFRLLDKKGYQIGQTIGALLQAYHTVQARLTLEIANVTSVDIVTVTGQSWYDLPTNTDQIVGIEWPETWNSDAHFAEYSGPENYRPRRNGPRYVDLPMFVQLLDSHHLQVWSMQRTGSGELQFGLAGTDGVIAGDTITLSVCVLSAPSITPGGTLALHSSLTPVMHAALDWELSYTYQPEAVGVYQSRFEEEIRVWQMKHARQQKAEIETTFIRRF